MNDGAVTSEGVPLEMIIAQLEDQDPNRIIIRSEFACVSVQLRDPGGRPRLLVEDLRTRQTVELDALELESLAWAQHKDLSNLLDPSKTRWIGSGD
jgi:hypothetical protein